jgi:hypothetical protein
MSPLNMGYFFKYSLLFGTTLFLKPNSDNMKRYYFAAIFTFALFVTSLLIAAFIILFNYIG